MHTFNLGLVFGNGEIVCIIVCGSENPIDRNEVNRVATKYFNIGMATKSDLTSVINSMIDGIREECGVNAVLVNADVSCVIPKK